MFPHILIIIDYDVQVILSLAIIRVGLLGGLCVPSPRSGFVVTSVPSGCELSQTYIDSAPGPVSKEPWLPWWLEGEKSLVDRKGPRSLQSHQSEPCLCREADAARGSTMLNSLASGWPCRKGSWRRAQKNQTQLSPNPSRRGGGQELTGVRRVFS